MAIDSKNPFRNLSRHSREEFVEQASGEAILEPEHVIENNSRDGMIFAIGTTESERSSVENANVEESEPSTRERGAKNL